VRFSIPRRTTNIRKVSEKRDENTVLISVAESDDHRHLILLEIDRHALQLAESDLNTRKSMN
jgi:hypothetical protein